MLYTYLSHMEPGQSRAESSELRLFHVIRAVVVPARLWNRACWLQIVDSRVRHSEE